MEPFASVEDYRRAYPDDEIADDVLHEKLLEATDVMCPELDEHDIDYSDPSESFTYRLMRICRTMVHRAIGSTSNPDVPFGATEFSETNDFVNAATKFANPYGDLFLTEQERRSLGIGAARACVLSPYG